VSSPPAGSSPSSRCLTDYVPPHTSSTIIITTIVFFDECCASFCVHVTREESFGVFSQSDPWSFCVSACEIVLGKQASTLQNVGSLVSSCSRLVALAV